MAAFQKCFYGNDRVRTLIQVLQFNAKEYREGDSPPAARNRIVIGMLLSAEMYEMAKAIQGLGGAKVLQKITNRENWTNLDKLRARWQSDQAATEVRNQVGHHHGHLETYQKGLSVVLSGSPEKLTFFEGASESPLAGFARLSLSSLLMGLRTTIEQFEKLFPRAKADIEELPELLFGLLWDVFRTAGISIEDRRSNSPG